MIECRVCLGAQLEQLKDSMKPFLLRRLKQDVETKLPPKEEIIIEVELTALQQQFYRAICERNLHAWESPAASVVPSLNNITMELRKVRARARVCVCVYVCMRMPVAWLAVFVILGIGALLL
jgi:SNF2 family DNA or RNA helicase